MSYMAPEEGSHVRQSIPVFFLYEHVLKMSINVNCGYEEEFQVSVIGFDLCVSLSFVPVCKVICNFKQTENSQMTRITLRSS